MSAIAPAPMRRAAASAISALEVEAGDPRPLAGERLGDAEAEPLPRAGHERRLALEPHGLLPVPACGAAQLAFLRSSTSSSSIARARIAAGRALISPQ